MPSAGFFSVGQGAFSYAIRSRLGLPALMGAKPGVDADEYARGGECNEFLQRTTHTGDDIADFNIGAERFDHHARTWASWTHHAFTRQMVACAMASGTHAGVAARSREMIRAQSYGLGKAAALYEPNVAPPCPDSDAA